MTTRSKSSLSSLRREKELCFRGDDLTVSQTVVKWAVVCISLLLFLVDSSRSAVLNQVTEVAPHVPIQLSDGFLSYLHGIGNSSTPKGVFMYTSKRQQGDTSTSMRFFHALPNSSFSVQVEAVSKDQILETGGVHQGQGEGTWLTSANSSSSGTCAYSASPGYASQSQQFYFNVDHALACTDGVKMLIIQSDAFEAKVWKMSHHSISAGYSNGSSELMVQITVGTPTIQLPNVISQTIDMVSHLVALEQNGAIILINRASSPTTLANPQQIVANFQPKFAFADRSRVCISTNCDIVALEMKSNNVWLLTMLNFQIRRAPQIGIIKFPSLDISSVGTSNMPVWLPNSRSFFIVGATKFHLYNIFDDRFLASGDVASVEYSSMVQNTLVVGALNATLYPDKVIAMAMFQDNAVYIPKMILFESTRCKTRDSNGSCSECELNYVKNGVGGCDQIEPCRVENCKLCTQNTVCEECNHGYTLDQNVCNLDTEQSTGNQTTTTNQTNQTSIGSNRTNITKNSTNNANTTNTTNQTNSTSNTTNNSTNTTNSSMTTKNVKLEYRSFFSSNSFEVLFTADQSKTVVTVEVHDTDANQILSCEETNCKHKWNGDALQLSFDPPKTVSSGFVLLRRRTTTRSVRETRTLQVLDDTDVIIPNVVLVKSSWFDACATILQLILFLYRTVGSLLIFPRYPQLALLPDRLVTTCMMLCMFTGPLIPSTEVVLQIIGQIKILWFRMANITGTWDPHTRSISTAPNSWRFPVYTSFLDNYLQNTIGFGCLAAVLVVIRFICEFYKDRKSILPKVQTLAQEAHGGLGSKYWLHRFEANGLEIFMYAMICFDKADASSKSIIGIVLAVGYVCSLVAIPVHSTYNLIIKTPAAAENTNSSEFAPLWKQFSSVALFLRNLVWCVLSLKLLSNPLSQLAIAATFQFLYIGYLVLAKHHSWLEVFPCVLVDVFALLVLVLKAISTSPGISNSALDTGLGIIIGIILIATGLIILVAIPKAIYELFKPTATTTEKIQSPELGRLQYLSPEQEPQQKQADLQVQPANFDPIQEEGLDEMEVAQENRQESSFAEEPAIKSFPIVVGLTTQTIPSQLQ